MRPPKEQLKVGDYVKCRDELAYPSLTKFREKVLQVSEVNVENQSHMIRIYGCTEKFWAGWFKKFNSEPLFKVGDKVKYVGQMHGHLTDKVLTVKELRHFGLDNAFVLLFNEAPHMYSQELFQLALPKVQFPYIREVLIEMCNKDIVNDGMSVHVHIVNSKLKDQTNYNKNDIMTVLRALEEFHVEADLIIKSTMNDALTVVLSGESIMEELGSNAPKTLPVDAIVYLCDRLDLTMTLDNHDHIYVLGYGGVIYESKKMERTA